VPTKSARDAETGGEVALGNVEGNTAKKRRVRDDWTEPLPAARHKVFGAQAGELEAGYQMVSVALNAAFANRSRGELVKARQQVAVAGALLERVAGRLLEAIEALQEVAARLNQFPAVEPLRPEFFRGEKAVRAAWWNAVLHGPLWQAKLRLVHKLWTLRSSVRELRDEFGATADEIAGGMCIEPTSRWELLEVLHFDLNTLLRETTVMLKSFLLAISTDEFESFQRRLGRTAPLVAKTGPGLTRAST
jgi:hypothetical protein